MKLLTDIIQDAKQLAPYRTKLYDLYLNTICEVVGFSKPQLLYIEIHDHNSKKAKLLRTLTSSINATAVTISKNEIVFLKSLNWEYEYVRIFQLMAHELTHIKQMRERGRFKFSIKYFWEYGLGVLNKSNIKEAYQSISLEKEAVENAKEVARHVLQRGHA